MKQRSLWGWMVGMCLSSAVCAQDPAWPNPLPVCEDGAEWPPFTHYQRDAKGLPTSRVVGYSVDVLERILTPLGGHARIQLLPWARCQQEVEQGERFAMALNASASPERSQRFLMSRAFYQTRNVYFYSKRHHGSGLPIRTLSDLGRFRVCGVLGYNYSMYQLPAQAIDTGARDLTRVVAMLHAGRCDLGLEKLEVLAGTRITGANLLDDPHLGVEPVPDMAPSDFHMMISRRYPALLEAIDAGLKRLQASGELDRLRSRYLP